MSISIVSRLLSQHFHSTFSILQTSNFRLRSSQLIDINTSTSHSSPPSCHPFQRYQILGRRSTSRTSTFCQCLGKTWASRLRNPESPAAETEGNQESQGSDTEKPYAKPSEEAQAQIFPDDPCRIKACAVRTRCGCMPPGTSARPSNYYLIRAHPALNCSDADFFAAITTLPDVASVEKRWYTLPSAHHALGSFIDNPSYGSKYLYCYRAVVGEGVRGDSAARNW